MLQNIATPHNNTLIRHLKRESNINLNLWYEKESDLKYGWRNSITHEHQAANIYGSKINWKFLWQHLRDTESQHIVVGWGNLNTQLLTLFFVITGRKFFQWSDTPIPRKENFFGKFSRFLLYALLKFSKVHILATGKLAVSHFLNAGFSEEKVFNFPIFIETDYNIDSLKLEGRCLRRLCGIEEDAFLITSGSRFVFDKGFDLLLKGFSQIEASKRVNFHLLLVGKGEEESNLKHLVKELDIDQQVTWKSWLEFYDFQRWIAASEIFVQPCRFDAYGGTTLAMSLGVPVIGTYTSGAAADRIVSGENGFLYQAEDTDSLAKLMTLLWEQPQLRERMAASARNTALQWSPEKGAKRLLRLLESK